MTSLEELKAAWVARQTEEREASVATATARNAYYAELDRQMVEELAARGIVKGCKVKVGRENGIFLGVSNGSRIVAKMTKSGDAHKTARVWVWGDTKIEAAE